MKTIVKDGITYEGEKLVEDGDIIRCECGECKMVYLHDFIDTDIFGCEFECKKCGSKVRGTIPRPKHGESED